MARQLATGKQSVNLASSGPRVSRIRRDPPPAEKAKVVLDPDERDQWNVTVGILAFALAIFVITLAVAAYAGWTPRQYTVQV